MPLARLRAGRTVEIGEGPLALTEEESTALLASVGADLDPEERAALHRRTEGWPAGLHPRSADRARRPAAAPS